MYTSEKGKTEREEQMRRMQMTPERLKMKEVINKSSWAHTWYASRAEFYCIYKWAKKELQGAIK